MPRLAARGRSRATGRSSPRRGLPTPVIVPVAVIGLMTNDGYGTFSAAVTANINGGVTQEDFTGVTCQE